MCSIQIHSTPQKPHARHVWCRFLVIVLASHPRTENEKAIREPNESHSVTPTPHAQHVRSPCRHVNHLLHSHHPHTAYSSCLRPQCPHNPATHTLTARPGAIPNAKNRTRKNQVILSTGLHQYQAMRKHTQTDSNSATIRSRPKLT